MKHKLMVAGAGMALILTNGVQAETISVKLEQYAFSPLIVSMPGRDIHAGQYQGLIDGKAGTAWCVELGQFLQFGTTVEYEILDADAVFGPAVAQVLDSILSWQVLGHPADARESADMQVDIWRTVIGELVSGLYNSPLTVEAFVLHNNDRQDLLIGRPWVAVDEPAPGLLIVLGLGLLAVRSRYGV